jgi:hypothetical protein
LLLSKFSSFQTASPPRSLLSFALAAGFLKGVIDATPLKSSVYRHLS